jgi:hypothetical protein
LIQQNLPGLLFQGGETVVTTASSFEKGVGEILTSIPKRASKKSGAFDDVVA